MRKLLISSARFLVLVMLACGIISQHEAYAAGYNLKLYLSPSSATFNQNDTTSLQIRLSKQTTSRVDYVEAHLSFSASHLAVSTVSKTGSSFTSSNGPTITYSNSKGTITVTGSSNNLPTPANVLVATITFKAKASGKTAVKFTSASHAGDITNGGHVKDYLDATSGATLTVAQPTTSSSSQSDSPAAAPTDFSSTPSKTNSSDSGISSQPNEPTKQDSIPITDTTTSEQTSPTATAEPTGQNIGTKLVALGRKYGVISAAAGSLIVCILLALIGRSLIRRGAHERREDQQLFQKPGDIQANLTHESPATVVVGTSDGSIGTSTAGTTTGTTAARPQGTETGPTQAQPAAATEAQVKLTRSTVNHEAVIQPLGSEPPTSAAQPVQVPAMPGGQTMQPVAPPQPVTQRQSQPPQPAGPQLTPTPPVSPNDSKGEPLDMFEMGEQRLSNEGYQRK